MKNRFLCLLLAAVLLLCGVLTACGSSGQPDETTPGETAAQTGSETAPETGSDKIEPNLPALTFDDKEIHCLHWTLDNQGPGGGWIPWEEIAVEQQDGEELNDNVYMRNAYVEETYGVRITTEYASANIELPLKVQQAFATGDDVYSFIVERSGNLTSLWTNEYFYNLRGENLAYLDLDKPWWNQDSLRTFTFGGVTQFASSELLILDKSETSAVFFSTVIQENKGLENFYDLVKNKAWTMEALIRNAEICKEDLNGDLVMDAKDRYGSCGNRTVGSMSYVGAGLKFADIDKDGYLYTDVGSADSIELMQIIHEDLIYQPFHAHSDYISDFKITEKFMDNEIGFLYYSVKMANTLREMETNYGILPIPMADESQDRYYDLISTHGDSLLAIPVSNQEPDVTAFVLEALTAESYYTVYPAFFNVVMMGKCTRDPESRDMLEIIFQNRTYDIGLIYGLGDFAGNYEVYAANHFGDTGFASLYKSFEPKINEAVETLNELIDEWNG